MCTVNRFAASVFFTSACVLVAATTFLPAESAMAQQLPGEDQVEDDTPEVVPQQESLKIEPYTGPAILLDEPPTPPPATEVESREVTDYYDPEEKEKPRTKRTLVKYSDDTRKSHGAYEEFFENGQTFAKGEYRHGVPVGTWEYFHENGTPAKTVVYVDGQPTGKIEVKRADGTLLAKREFDAGKRTGDWTTFDETGEQPIIESHYTDGQPSGVWQLWHPNGKKRQQLPFVDGKRHGTIIEWDDQGVKRGESTFVEGLREGSTRMWMADGREVVREFEAGKLISSKQVE